MHSAIKATTRELHVAASHHRGMPINDPTRSVSLPLAQKLAERIAKGEASSNQGASGLRPTYGAV